MRPGSALLAIASSLVIWAAHAHASAPETETGPLTPAAAVADTAPTSPAAILYYFHRTVRCNTCLAIEAGIEQTLKAEFPAALKAGRLLWLPTNIEQAGNEHFSEDFALEFNSAILVRLDAHGNRSSWTNLEQVWDLLEDQEAFSAYIAENVQMALGTRAPSDPEP